ncbi:hsp90 co-chaperone Cdc37-like 1 [Bufo bufo]|uniref:hsp90 co-chaperone Cdc37-like 1 n=1 Tax=Bufo bufo TaxID=8384 RepID=UPI001ABE0772|nr:hsp90 co-chaperone Cdc37-like 1 [Bufo bufo]
MDYPCQELCEGDRSSLACMLSLAEAQQKLNSLALHNSESIDQEHAKARAEVSELQRSEEEWRRKEAALPLGENGGMSSSDAFSQEVFNKSFINQGKREQEDEPLSFIQRYEGKIRHFGMLSRWNDSQCFLSEYPDLVCEETARYLQLWCYHLESEQKKALMEQVAHQAVVMQFIIEMAKSSNVDPRGCFRLFFQKAKAEEQGYFEAFKTELEAFKLRVRMHTESSRCSAAMVQNVSFLSDYGNVRTQCFNQQDIPQCHLNTGTDHVNLMEQVGEEDTKMMDML